MSIDSPDRPTVALVTGANKGIGYEIALKLCRMMWEANDKHTGTVYVCARDLEKGRAAVNKLQGLYKGIPRLLQLDVEDETSVARASHVLHEEQHHIDVLVLNAGVIYRTAPPSLAFPKTFAVNYFGVRRCMDAFMPLMSPYGRVVIISSISGRDTWLATSEAARRKLLEATTPSDLDEIATAIITSAERETLSQEGWASEAYGNSKLLVTRLTQIEAERASQKSQHLLVNCCCPGWCKSDLAGWEKPPKTAEQGAETPYMLCMLPRQSTITGKFYENRQDTSYLEAASA